MCITMTAPGATSSLFVLKWNYHRDNSVEYGCGLQNTSSYYLLSKQYDSVFNILLFSCFRENCVNATKYTDTCFDTFCLPQELQLNPSCNISKYQMKTSWSLSKLTTNVPCFIYIILVIFVLNEISLRKK